MKAFLLSAGRATRLRPWTDRLPKCLIPIQGTPLLGIWLEICERAGITDVLINLHWNPEPVREFVKQWQTQVKVSFTFEKELLGSAGTIRENWEWVEGEPRFWVIYTDVLTTADLTGIAAFDGSHDDGVLTMGLHRVEDPAGCGIATTDGRGRITAFEEKSSNPKGSLAFAGILLARPTLLQYLADRTPLDFGFHVFPSLPGRMWGYTISEYLIDIGTKERLTTAEATWPGLGRGNSPPEE